MLQQSSIAGGYGSLRFNTAQNRKAMPFSTTSPTPTLTKKSTGLGKWFESSSQTHELDLPPNTARAAMGHQSLSTNASRGMHGRGTSFNDTISSSAPVDTGSLLLNATEVNFKSGSPSPVSNLSFDTSPLHSKSTSLPTSHAHETEDTPTLDHATDQAKHNRSHTKSNSAPHVNGQQLFSPSTPSTPGSIAAVNSAIRELVSADGELRLSVSGEYNEAVNIQEHDDTVSTPNEDSTIITNSGDSSNRTLDSLNSPTIQISQEGRRFSDCQNSVPPINTVNVKSNENKNTKSTTSTGGSHSTKGMGSFDFDVLSLGSEHNMTPISEDEHNYAPSDEETDEKPKRNSGSATLKPFGSMLIKSRKSSSSNASVKDLPKLRNEPSDARVQMDMLSSLNLTPQRSSEKRPFEVRSIHCSRNNSFILTKEDEIYWCGERAADTFVKMQDEELDGKKIKIFATAPFSDHFIIVTSQQEVLVSGNNSNGQLGDGTTLDCYGFLKKIKFDFGEDYSEEEKKYVDFKFVACGRAHTCIVATLNAKIDVFYSSGNNQFSQLGYALPFERSEFENPPSLPFERKEIKDIACGAQHTVVLTAEGEVWACGKGDLGQLGNGSYSPKNEFQKIELPSSYSIRRVFCGGGFTVLLTRKYFSDVLI